MTWLNVKNLKQAGLNTTEIDEIKKSIEDFEENQIFYNFEDIKEDLLLKEIRESENSGTIKMNSLDALDN